MRLTWLLALMTVIAGAEEPDEWYSHKRHAQLRLPCTYCHATAVKASRAGMPTAGRCLQCHQSMPVLKSLRKLSATARPFEPQYDNLPDYVIFSHAKHARGKVECAACHGKVTEEEGTGPANALNMKACVDCHQARGATTKCRMCHHVVRQR